MFCVSPAFVYLLSILLLNDRFSLLKTSAVILSLLGIVCIGISQKNLQGRTFGVILTLFSALSSAAYITLLKKLAGSLSLVSATTLLGLIGLINTLIFWPLLFMMHFFGKENYVFDEIPWSTLNLSAITGFFFNAFVNIGVGYTYPLFISVGTILGIPANILVDNLVHGYPIDNWQIAGSVLVGFAFIFLVFSKNETVQKDDKKIESQEKLLTVEIEEFSTFKKDNNQG